MNLKFKSITGFLTFFIVLLTMPIGHAIMVLVQIIFGEFYQFPAAILLGLVGFIFLMVGMGKENETTATWYGFFSGLFLWTGWVEFSFVYFAQHLNIPPEMVNGDIVTKPEYLLLPSSIGLLLATGVFFFLNSQTRCRFFIWFHKNLKMNIKRIPARETPNIAKITAIETIYVIWTFYVLLMIAYDPVLFGDYHWFTYSIFFGSMIWSVFLFLRLIKINKIAPAVRYAIPTVVIFWNSIEILGRWNFFEEIWVMPEEYFFELILIFLAFITAFLISFFTSEIEK